MGVDMSVSDTDIEKSATKSTKSSPILKTALALCLSGALIGGGVGIGFGVWGNNENEAPCDSTPELPIGSLLFNVAKLGTLHGLVENRAVVSPLARQTNAQSVVKFLAIPFAEPLGPSDRFTAPRPKSLPLASGNDVLEARFFGLKCPENNAWTGEFGEDCLNLNIYVPETLMRKVLTGVEFEPVPVLIWIHGGAFFLGSNADGPDDDNFETNKDDPSFFVTEHNVIVVKVNYRVGPLGFYALQEVEDTYQANWGVLDQTLAMEWVNTHIAQFGGDLTRRSLSGCSAGGQSVYVHLTENGAGSSELFDQAVVCAAPTGIPWFTLKQAIQFGSVLMEGLNCDSAECLRQKSLDELMQGMWGTNLLTEGPWHESLRYRSVTQMAEPYAPVIDDVVITDQTYQLLANHKLAKKTIIEYSTNEGEQFVTQVFRNDPGDEEAATVPRGKYHTLIKFMFEGGFDIPDYPMLENLLNDLDTPDDYVQCQVDGHDDCFEFLKTLNLGCGGATDPDGECSDEADEFLTAYSWTCPTRNALVFRPTHIYELELTTVHPTAQSLSENNKRCYEMSCHCVGPYYWFGNYAYWKDKELDSEDQAQFGQNLRQIYADFFYMKNIPLKSMADLEPNVVNMLDINESGLTWRETFSVCADLDKMDYYGYC